MVDGIRTNLIISCSLCSSCFCRTITDSMMALSSGVRWDKSGPSSIVLTLANHSTIQHYPSIVLTLEFFGILKTTMRNILLVWHIAMLQNRIDSSGVTLSSLQYSNEFVPQKNGTRFVNQPIFDGRLSRFNLPIYHSLL